MPQSTGALGLAPDCHYRQGTWMNKRLTMHIGLPKTGTTALQNFFFANRQALADDGILYPMAGLSGTSHYLLATQQPRRSWDAVTGYWKALFKEVEASPLEHTLVSSEFFCQDLAEALHGLASQYFTDIRIVLYLRRQDTVLYSTYNQLVRKKRFTRDIRSLVPVLLDYHSMVHALAATFGQENVLVRPYEQCQLRKGIYANFLATLGLALDKKYELPAGSGSVNASLHQDLLEFMRHCNQLPLLKPETEILDQALKGLCSLFLANFKVEPLLSPQERFELISCQADKDAEIARIFLGRPGGELFLEPWPDPGAAYEPYPGLTAEKQHMILDIMPQQARNIIEKLSPKARGRTIGTPFLPPQPMNNIEGLMLERDRMERELSRLYEVVQVQ